MVNASTVEPGMSVYGDSSGLEVQRIAPRATVQLSKGTAFAGGYEHEMLTARPGAASSRSAGTQTRRTITCGSAPRSGSACQPPRPRRSGAGGDAGLIAYAAGADFTPFDGLKFSVERNSGFFVLSPRTVGLGLRQLGHRAQLDWLPRCELAGCRCRCSHQTLSDGNRRWEFTISPRYSVARTAQLNLDLGFLVSQMGTHKNLDHGYYDPSAIRGLRGRLSLRI